MGFEPTSPAFQLATKELNLEPFGSEPNALPIELVANNVDAVTTLSCGGSLENVWSTTQGD
jgi:hypothetical protein